jgi:hypothetical protein
MTTRKHAAAVGTIDGHVGDAADLIEALLSQTEKPRPVMRSTWTGASSRESFRREVAGHFAGCAVVPRGRRRVFIPDCA